MSLRKNLPIVAAFALAVGIAAAQAAAPATAATAVGKMIQGWLEHYNRNDKAAIEQFARASYSAEFLARTAPAQIAEMDAGAFQQTGKLELFRVEAKSEMEAMALFRNADGSAWLRMEMLLEPGPPPKVSRLRLGSAERPEGAPAPARLTEPALLQALEKVLEDRAASDQFSGAVLIAKGGKPLFAKAYGMADRERKVPNRPDTKFALGSMNKMITSVAIAQLAQAGKLKFTDTVATLLPDYPNKTAAAKITVHHLLTHTSGLRDVFTPEWDAKKDSVRTVRDWFPFFVDKDLRFAPGDGWAYSNAGFVVLGAIVERVSGKDYYTYIRENIYKPAGMTHSDSYSKEDKVANMAEGYTRQGAPQGQRVNNVSTRPWRGFPAGGGYSTVFDLLKFSEALRAHRLLNAEFTTLILEGKHAPEPGSRKYAYGFEDNRADGLRTVGHGGGAPGMNGDLQIYWDGPYTVVALANLDPPAAGYVTRFVRQRIPAK